MGNDIDLDSLPELALLSIYIKLKFGALNTLRVRDAVDVFDVQSSSESGRQRRSNVAINGRLKIQWTRSLPRVLRRWWKSGINT